MDGMDTTFGMNGLYAPRKGVIPKLPSMPSMLSTGGGAEERYTLAWIISEWLNALRETGTRPPEDAS